MSTTIETLLKLQERDRRITRLHKESKDVPARREHIEARIQKEKEAVAEAHERLKQQQSDAKQVELDVESQKDKIAKLRNQQFEVKNNDDYRTLEREIKSAEEDITKLEDAEIEIMETMEETRAFIAEREGDLKRGEEHVKADLVNLDERLTSIESEVQQLDTDRKTLAEELDPEWLTRYERILNHTGNFALVPIEHGGCGGCHMKIPPQVTHDARKGTSMVSCPYCGRLLYSE